MPERLRGAGSYAVAAWHAVARGDVSALRVGWWALRAARSVHRQLPRRGPGAVDLPGVPAIGTSAAERNARLVGAVAARHRASCLEAALVAQAWARAHGRPRDVIVGVTAPGKGFAAHAWLDGDEVDPRYVELWRVAAGARSENTHRQPHRQPLRRGPAMSNPSLVTAAQGKENLATHRQRGCCLRRYRRPLKT